MEEQQNDRPKIQLELQADGLKISWGPPKGLWGIFNKGTKPVEVEIKEWWLFVGTLVSQQKPDHGSKDIFSKSVDTMTEMMIPRDLLPQQKVVVAQVLGSFDSQKMNGERFVEGIYSNVAQMEIK